MVDLLVGDLGRRNMASVSQQIACGVMFASTGSHRICVDTHSRRFGVSGLVVECRACNFQVTGSNLTAGHLQATLSKLLTYGVLRSTQPLILCGTGNE